MANDNLSSMLTQRRKALDALAIEMQSQFEALDTRVAQAGKTVEKEVSAFEKQLDTFLGDMRKRLERELAQTLTKTLLSETGLGGAGSGSTNLLGISQNQWGSMLSGILTKATRNL